MIFFKKDVFKSTNKKLEKDLYSHVEDNRIMQEKIEKIEEENNVLKNRCFRYKEIALMQKEDSDALLTENLKIMKYVHSLEKRMKEIKKKMGYNMELLNNLKEDEFEKDNNLLKQIGNFMMKEFTRSLKKTEKEDIAKKSIEEEFEQNEESDLAKYQYFKPGFYTLIKLDVMKKNDPIAALNTLKKKSELKISPMFLSTIRAILDSKYNEFLLYEDYKQITKFPEFVYSWLSKKKNSLISIYF